MLKPILAALATAVLLGGCATAPSGRSQLLLVSDSQMTQLGAASFEQMKASDKLSRDARKSAYVDCIVAARAAELSEPWRSQAWEAQVFAIDSANAFALPGGKVGVNTGLFDVAKNQDQLAAVIGHEIGHVVSRHANERVSHSTLAEAGSGLVAAYVGRNSSPEQVKQYVALLGAGTQVGVLLPYSRLHESEADTLGQELMAKAGFDPAGAAALWQNMIAAAGSGASPPRLLSTHPDPAARASALAARAPQLAPVAQAARAAGKRPACG